VEERTGCRKVSGQRVPRDIGAPTLHLERIVMITLIKRNTTEKLLFLLEAQLFHGCTRKEALMLWNDGIDTLYDSVSTQTIHTGRMDK
jgi:hypothetical protein